MKTSAPPTLIGTVLGMLLVALLFALDGIIVMLAWNDSILPTFRDVISLPYLTIPVGMALVIMGRTLVSSPGREKPKPIRRRNESDESYAQRMVERNQSAVASAFAARIGLIILLVLFV